MGIDTFGQVEKPDFAFPKDVSQTASADLKRAIETNDAHKALNALIRLSLAEEEIDYGSLQQSIRTAESVSEKFAQSPESGLFDCFLARLYNAMYMFDQSKYNNRKLPLSPLPEDLTEWSGEQFRQKKKQLCLSALSKAAELSKLKISDFSDIILADKVTQAYYPTVLDFVCSEIISNLDYTLRESVVGVGKAYAEKGSAPYILWTSEENYAEKDPEYYKIEFEKYKDSPAASLLLCKYLNSVDYDEAKDGEEWFPIWGVNVIDSYLKSQPTVYLADWLKKLRNDMLEQKVNVTMPSYCMPGDTVAVKCLVENAPMVNVEIYFIPEEEYGQTKFSRKYLSSANPEAQKSVSFSQSVPFRTECEVKFLIKKCGYYAVLPKIGGGDYEHRIGYMRCIPIFPFAINGAPKPLVAVVNPKSGKPINDVYLQYSQHDGANTETAKTNSQGIAKFNDFLVSENGKSNELKINYKGQIFDFSDLNISKNRGNSPKYSRSISVLTDRGLYHPGDKLNALFVASEMNVSPDNKLEGSVISGYSIMAVLKNANWQAIDTVVVSTDYFGRATVEFTLPAEGLTGNFRIEAIGNEARSTTTFMVSDYKMPDFEIEVKSTLMDEPSAGSVTLKGKASYYSGMPVANAKISVELSKLSYWRWNPYSSHIISKDIQTDDNGAFSITFDKDVLSAGKGYFFTAKFSAVSPSGTSAECQATFIVGKKYIIEVATDNLIDGEKPFSPDVKVLDSEGNYADIPLKWSLLADKTVIESGDLGNPIDLIKIKPGKYEFRVEPCDTALAEPAICDILIYNRKSGIAPTDGLWCLNNSLEYTPGTQAEILIASPAETTVYSIFSVGDSLIKLDAKDIKPGYFTMKFYMPAWSVVDGEIILASVHDFKLMNLSIKLKARKEPELKIIGETFRDRLTPGMAETWKIRLAYADSAHANGAVVLDMYNKALDAIYPYSPGISFAKMYLRNYYSLDFPRERYIWATATHRLPAIEYSVLSSPNFNFYGQILGPEILYSIATSRTYKASAQAVTNDKSSFLDEVSEEEAMEVNESAQDAGGIMDDVWQDADIDKFEYRDSDVPLAIWAPTLATDDQGNLCYSFTVPNANATWKLTVLAWTKDLKLGKLTREFIASKPIMVAPNVPRFLRQGDVCQVSASVLNNSDSACVATSVIDIFNPANGKVLSSKTFVNDIDAKASAIICIDVDAGYDLPAIGYRVRSDNGQGFADGEQSAIPVLTSMAAVVEAKPFYMNPGEKIYETPLPEAEGARLSLTFCENPSWTIVSALPGLRELDKDYANNAAATIFSACVAQGIIKDNPEIGKALKSWKDNPADSALVSMLEKNEDLKIALLSATPWVQAAQSENERMASLAMILDDKDADKAIDSAIDALKKLQMADGGFAWGQWCQRSSVWTTANVLDMLGQLRHAGWLPKDKDLDAMISRAVKYYDKEVEGCDMMYAVVRRYFDEMPISLNGQASISKTTTDILKNWKKYANPAIKALAAEALYLNNYPAKSKNLLNSISQFGVMTPTQGLTFPSVDALSSYAQILRAYARIMPNAPQVDGLRQQLIVRKQGADWGSSVVTSEVVAAILYSGAKWSVPANGAVISIGGASLKANNVEAATGSLKADVSEFAGQKLEIATSGISPSYGAVFAQYSRQMDKVEPASCDDLRIEKRLSVRQADGTWAYASDSLTVGDRVKVQLTIHCKRDLQYVEIKDERPATFQPVNQLPGWIWAEGVGFYRENRDAFTALHVEGMGKGTYILSYEMNVSQSGRFSSGIASIQSQYAPEITAHSAAGLLMVKSSD